MASRTPIDEMPKCHVCGKVRYETKQQAYKMATSLQGHRGRRMMEAYKCKWCKGYHLTHYKT